MTIIESTPNEIILICFSLALIYIELEMEMKAHLDFFKWAPRQKTQLPNSIYRGITLTNFVVPSTRNGCRVDQ